MEPEKVVARKSTTAPTGAVQTARAYSLTEAVDELSRHGLDLPGMQDSLKGVTDQLERSGLQDLAGLVPFYTVTQIQSSGQAYDASTSSPVLASSPFATIAMDTLTRGPHGESIQERVALIAYGLKSLANAQVLLEAVARGLDVLEVRGRRGIDGLKETVVRHRDALQTFSNHGIQTMLACPELRSAGQLIQHRLNLNAAPAIDSYFPQALEAILPSPQPSIKEIGLTRYLLRGAGHIARDVLEPSPLPSILDVGVARYITRVVGRAAQAIAAPVLAPLRDAWLPHLPQREHSAMERTLTQERARRALGPDVVRQLSLNPSSVLAGKH